MNIESLILEFMFLSFYCCSNIFYRYFIICRFFRVKCSRSFKLSFSCVYFGFWYFWKVGWMSLLRVYLENVLVKILFFGKKSRSI